MSPSLSGSEWRSSNKSASPNPPLLMSTTRNIKARSISITPSSSFSPSISPPVSPQPNPPSLMSAQPNPRESTAESPNEFNSLPPRMRLKDKRKHFGEFRIIREPTAAIHHHTTEFKPIPSPPWAKDPDSSHRLDNDTRGKEPSHAHTSFPSNATPGGPPFRHRERCTRSRNSSKSSECSSTAGLQTPSPHAWTTSNRSPLLNSSFLSTSSSLTPPHQKDDISSDAGPSSLEISYHLRPHRTIKPRPQTTSIHKKEESIPDEDEDKITIATAALEQLQHSGMQSNTFPPPARPSRKQKRYACDICGQIFTRSGDVRRHQESRHHNSEGCRCPFCDRVLTR